MTPQTAPAFRLVGVRQRYGLRTVLDVPELSIARGETLGIIGPSGAGKSTLLRLLQGLERPSDGAVEVDGVAHGHPFPLDVARQTTTVFQRPAMLDRTVRENVAFGLSLRKRADAARVTDLIERLGLTHLADARARRLSGGEMQRVAVARAMATGCTALLLDEPAANLDPAHVSLVERMIREEQARGTTLALVTHNTHEARRLAHRTLLLIDGRVVEVAPTEAFFDRPVEARTKAFLAGELVY